MILIYQTNTEILTFNKTNTLINVVIMILIYQTNTEILTFNKTNTLE